MRVLDVNTPGTVGQLRSILESKTMGKSKYEMGSKAVARAYV